MTQRRSTNRPTKTDLAIRKPTDLLAEVREMILQARASVARAVDSGLTTLYWHIGQRIRQGILKEKRAEYGEEIVSALGRQLEQEFGRGFSGKSVERKLHEAVKLARARLVAAKD